MTTREDELQFRQALIIRLSATDFVRRVARRGWRDADAVLAQSLGVSAYALASAVRLAQVNWPMPDSIRQDLFIPKELRPNLTKVFRRANLSPGHYVRALCHACMQTTWEPSPRRRVWVEPVRREPGKRTRRPYSHVSTRFNSALATALDMRSAALGMTRHSYILHWIADLAEGRLRALPVPVVPVTVDLLHSDASAYVLPRSYDEQTKRSRADARARTTGRGSARASPELDAHPVVEHGQLADPTTRDGAGEALDPGA